MRDDNDTSSNNTGKPDELLTELDSIKQLLDEELEKPRTAPATSIEEIGSVEEYLRLKQAAAAAGLSMEAYLANLEEEQELEAEDSLEVDEASIPVLDEVIPLDEEESEEEEQHSPTTSEATTVEEYFAAVAAAKHRPSELSPTIEESEQEAEIPVLDEVVEEEALFEVEEEPPLLDEVEAVDEIPTLEEVVDEVEAIPVLEELATDAPEMEAEEEVTLDEMQEMVDLIVERKLQQLRPELEKEVMAELQKLLPISALSKP